MFENITLKTGFENIGLENIEVGEYQGLRISRFENITLKTLILFEV
jgi:hypothetical protein